MSKKLLTLADLRARGICLSPSRLRRLEQAGEFPRRVRISDRSFGWVPAEIDTHIKGRIAERDAVLA